MERIERSIELNNQNYCEKLASKKIIVLELFNEWIGSCLINASVLRELAYQFDEKQIEFFRANADKNTKIINEFGIHTVPGILFIKNGDVVHLISGLASKSEIEKIINNLIQES